MLDIERQKLADSGSVWSPENFSHTFGFQTSEAGFKKEIGGTNYTFRRVSSPEELFEVQRVQKVAWGWQDIEIAPVHILSLLDDTGGGVFSAINENGEMVGFAAGIGGGLDRLTGKHALISSMLAMNGVQFRSSGIGRELKIVQAYYAIQNGYEVMKWFYDPERGENASLNLRKLGAKAEEFTVDKYGPMKSELYGPVPTDRFRAVWRLYKKSTVDRLMGNHQSPALNEVGGIEVATPSNLPDSDKVLVEISPDIDAEEERDKIKRRLNLRKILSYYFLEKGYIATEFITDVENGRRKSYYLLEPQNRGDLYDE